MEAIIYRPEVQNIRDVLNSMNVLVLIRLVLCSLTV